MSDAPQTQETGGPEEQERPAIPSYIYPLVGSAVAFVALVTTAVVIKAVAPVAGATAAVHLAARSPLLRNFAKAGMVMAVSTAGALGLGDVLSALRRPKPPSNSAKPPSSES